MTKKNHDADEEPNLFLNEMSGTLRHRDDRIEPYRKKIRPFPLPPEKTAIPAEEGQELIDLNIETGEILEYIRPGIQNRLFQELRRGHLPPEESLDLHGLRVSQARFELTRFLAFARHHRLRVIHIVHGKGFGSRTEQPVLKQKVNQWLRQRSEVLAFCSATRFDGGTGAVYVLLKRENAHN
ncbi:MAG: Smr/MutS family protein [Chromatiaceae bacterium]|nr:Smr/MutS family protein [Chromatiaceae bacterium]MCP5441617.1 Smr/MutS family protein [Chromatiaceae bacterium]